MQFVIRLLLAAFLAALVAAPAEAADGKRRDVPAKTSAASAAKKHRHAARAAKRPAVKTTTHRHAGSAYPSRQASRAVAAREAAARDAARSGSTAERPRAAPRERVESYRLDPPGAGRS